MLKKIIVLISTFVIASIGIISLLNYNVEAAFGGGDYSGGLDGMGTVGVSILENNNLVSGSLFTNIANNFKLGYKYNNSVKISNSGDVKEYVRVIIYKRWEGAQNLDSNLIKLDLGANGWLTNSELNNSSRLIYIYENPLSAGETTTDIITGLQIDSAINEKYTVEKNTDSNGYTRTTMSKTYDDCSFIIEITVNAVDAEPTDERSKSAILSECGMDVNIENGKIVSIN